MAGDLDGGEGNNKMHTVRTTWQRAPHTRTHTRTENTAAPRLVSLVCAAEYPIILYCRHFLLPP